MTLNGVGRSWCRRTAPWLALEPELAATMLLCPRGCGPLSTVADVYECVICGGIFLTHQALATLVERHRTGDASIQPKPPAPDHVMYIPCPTCNVRMNRTVFGRSSGVIVDVCRRHGTWFDARELTASLAFVERGGLELVAKREAERKAEEARNHEVERRVRELEAASLPGSGRSGSDFQHADALRGLVEILLSL